MDVPNILAKFSTKEKQKEQFIAIEVGSESVTTAIWQVVSGQTQIVNVGNTEDWEIDKRNESLLAAIDVSLTKTLEGIDPEPNKVIFGLQETWVEGESITKQYSKQLKEVCDKFEFEPIGFVVTAEAIVQLLKKIEGTPTTAILIRVNESELQVSVVNLGRIVKTETVARSEDIGADVEEGLARFEIDDNLPSQMLIYDSGGDLEKLKQDLLSYNWLEKLPFLHFPKVKILEKQTAIRAVAISGGAEAAKAMGFEIIKDEQEEKRMDLQDELPTSDIEESKKETEKELKQEISTFPKDEEQIAEAETIGFKIQDDVSEISSKEQVAMRSTREEPKKAIKAETEVIGINPEKQDDIIPQNKDLLDKILAIKSSLSSFLVLTKRKISDFGSLFGSKIKLGVLTSLIILTLLMAAALYAYWVIPKAKLIIYLRPKNLEEELTVTIDPSRNQVIEGETVIPGKLLETEVESSKEKETTGTKIVGEKAKGEVVIYNKTSAEKTFAAGTIILATNNLQYSLESEINVASASAQESDESVTTVYGKAKANVAASAIGAEYNLSADETFRFKSYSSASYYAKNETDFKGGSSREVQAISQDDINQLTNELTSQLKQMAKEKLEEQEGSGKEVLSDGATTEMVSKELSGEVGDEAQKINLTLKLKIKTIAYMQSDLEQVLQSAVSASIPENFELREDASTKDILSVDYEAEKVTINLLFKATLIPKINEAEIKDEIVGKYPDIAREYLESLPNYSKADIEITPGSIPAKLKTFPRKKDNISLKIEVED